MSQGWADVREELQSLDAGRRARALDELLAAYHAGQLAIALPNDLVNMHCHTFFSYNGYGHSPTSLAWLAKENGWHGIGMVDFDVLDAVDECLSACDRAEVRSAAGLETRAYWPSFAAHEINSPGEPGVLYYVGVGFVSAKAPGAAQAVLTQMRQGAEQRNRDMVARINAYLDPVVIDYDRDVLPLTPAGNATERHMLVAYDAVARHVFSQRAALVGFWAAKLGADADHVAASLGATPGPNELVRSKLMKRGGIGYVQPGPDTFPPWSQVNEAIIACGAIPLYAYLDGASEGEQRMEELLNLQLLQGMAGINIVPDRNWNFADATVRETKVRALYAVVELARSLDLPIVIGTEMNKAGQRLVDDLDAEPLRPLKQDFVQGAQFVYGHTAMQRALGRGYQSDWARRYLRSRGERNSFFTEIGRLVEPGARGLGRLAALDVTYKPGAILAELQAQR